MPAEFYSRFLVQRFAMMDVIMSLLRRRKPIAPAPFILYQQHEEADIHGPPFRELTGCPQSVLPFWQRYRYWLAMLSWRTMYGSLERINSKRLCETVKHERIQCH
ncbi:transcriptional regulatory protein pro-1 [Fusarium globosum]|uniref:Transcriptional regulatory protein pro-1 n=1 Tax=Fusarium globosum TaxID=78864 RepID=A0A8H5XMT7_9HYPO|nr:transcriptional regulatory protein pro-1 [Fusarium globosum]